MHAHSKTPPFLEKFHFSLSLFLDVALILMSRENYIIALFNKELLDIHIPGTSVKMYTKVLEWSLQFSLFNWYVHM